MVDPDTDCVFYVGITMYPATRLSSHLGDRASAVFAWAQEKGVEPHMVVLGRFPTLEEAREAEERLISFVPGLVNRDVEATRRRIRDAGSCHILMRRRPPNSMTTAASRVASA
jgi:hypothetical protein